MKKKSIARCCALVFPTVFASVALSAPSLDSVVMSAVRRHYESLHGCYRQVLAEDRTRHGTIFVRIRLRRGDLVGDAEIERDELGHPRAAACLLRWVAGWSFPGATQAGAGPGSEIVVPLTFRGVPHQFRVHVEDVLPRTVQEKTTAQLLLTKANSGADQATLVLTTVRRTFRLPKQSSDQVLYVLAGKGAFVSKETVAKLVPGSAVWVPPGVLAKLTPRTAELRVLHGFVPGGPEQRYGSGADGKQPIEEDPVVVAPETLRQTSLRDGAMHITPILRLPHGRFYLGLLQVQRGTQLTEHTHLSEAELIFVRQGRAQMRLGNEQATIGREQAIYIPRWTPHSLQVVDDVTAVQFYAPAGPEKRFFRKPPAN